MAAQELPGLRPRPKADPVKNGVLVLGTAVDHLLQERSIWEIDGVPRSYMELSAEHGESVLRFRYTTVALGFRMRGRGLTEDPPKQLQKGAAELLEQILQRLETKAKDLETTGSILWRTRPRYEYWSGQGLWMWSCRLATSPPIEFPSIKAEGDEPSILGEDSYGGSASD